ncbi:MAG: hypothetical protein HQ582_15065 [Planctomycetes bacterium]|nr:hypothetical protein [Planctomycetota bacterium]
MLEEFVEHVQDFTGCAGVGIRVLDEKGNIPYEAYCGFDQRFYEAESPLSIKSDQCMCINVIEGTTDPELPFYTKGGSFYTNGTTRLLASVSEEEKGRTRNVCNEVGYESVALVPIRLGDRVLGLIHIADPQENMVPLESVLVLEGAAMQLGTAIQRVRAEEATRQAQEKLLDQQRHETERVETELGKVREELVRKTQLAAIGQVSASIAHDLRNPLGSVRNAAYYLKRILPKEDPQIAEFLGVIEEEVQAADRIIGGLLGMTQGREPGKQTVNLARLVTEVLNRRDLRGAVRCRITTDPDPFEVSADPGQLRQLIGNLLENAIDTMGGHGEFIVEAARSAAYDTILVRDTGPGVALGVRENLIEPLVSTKAKGIGLGLAICRQIAESHGGTIDVAHHEGPGAAFEIRLPR